MRRLPIRAGGTAEVIARNTRAFTNEVPRADEEAGCRVATGAMELSGVVATTAYDAVGVAPMGCLTRWRRAMEGQLQTRPGQSIHCR